MPGERSDIKDIVKLNTNEGPYGPSPKALMAMHAAVDESLRLYHDPDVAALRRAIAKHNGIRSTNVCVGNGFDDGLVKRLCAYAIYITGLSPDLVRHGLALCKKTTDVMSKILRQLASMV